MRKSVLFMMILMMVLISLQGCTQKRSINNELTKNLNTKIISGDVIKSEDTHGGFHGDGERIIVIKYNADSVDSMLSNIQNSGKWSEFPLNESLNLLMYGGSKGYANYVYKFAESVGIPQIEHGYYCFVNRQTDSEETDILNSHSLNFTIAMFDSDNNILYYFEKDT
ncbi:hypothetical protein [[Clostridium] fimetarium]|uniref:Lipoprotein n=1 Tax=[Clostridium] fimetarium TaxID=99656 RepID=A0A1I0Q883_9FIRM|nr:hypothetical protein [[Clostridium] fimetarium]SEW22787.1 hypothetical protein SAMN05421659_10753 [[Clostridium] fimetarium]